MSKEYYAEIELVDEYIYLQRIENNNGNFKIITIPHQGIEKVVGFKFKFSHDDKLDCSTIGPDLANKVDFYLDFLSSITLYSRNIIYYKIKILDIKGNELCRINLDKMRILIEPPVIEMAKYKNTLENLKTENIEKLRYYSAGVKFLLNRLPEFALREFFKIIENDKDSIPDHDDYRIIRNLFSHNFSKLKKASIQFKASNLKNKFKYKEENEIIIIDAYDPNNIQRITRMANILWNTTKEIIFP